MWYKFSQNNNPNNNEFPEPGTLPIPSGTSRRFHYTKVDDDYLPTLKQEGLKREKSESYKYGDPMAIWSTPSMPNTPNSVVEYWEDPKNLQSDIYQFNDVAPHQILAIHEPWHDLYRYIKPYGLDEAIRRLKELMPDDEPTFKDERYVKVLKQLLKERDNVKTAGSKGIVDGLFLDDLRDQSYISRNDLVTVRMVDYDMDNNGTIIPDDFHFNIHSANPVGGANIRSYLENYLRVR